MRIHFPKYRTASPRALLFALILVFSINAGAQTSGTKDHSKTRVTTTPSLEKKFFVNILKDQRAIWTSPFHLHGNDAKWLAPLGLSTIALIATDRRTSGELVEHGDNLNRLRISHNLSQLGSTYATAGLAGALYLTGRASHNNRLRETGLLSAEALIDSSILVTALKAASQRQRPPVDHSSGEFFDGGHSFPSGHASSAWSVATVIAQEYGRHRPLLQVAAYGLASAVSLSRYTGRNHFLSDVLLGSAIGYATGRYVYHKHHDAALDAENEKQNDNNVNAVRSKLLPQIAPLYYPRAHVYGATLAWNF
ncbi:MAG TPA: phosphatase PAP2 family protein [Pyrinomonadaceae bacterium]|jgi:membrane-associated phospholipid phosphatase|nr:phosphatase PAP2 family protein [Pyrinomonadaceae bacterium]